MSIPRRPPKNSLFFLCHLISHTALQGKWRYSRFIDAESQGTLLWTQAIPSPGLTPHQEPLLGVPLFGPQHSLCDLVSFLASGSHWTLSHEGWGQCVLLSTAPLKPCVSDTYILISSSVTCVGWLTLTWRKQSSQNSHFQVDPSDFQLFHFSAPQFPSNGDNKKATIFSAMSEIKCTKTYLRKS